MAPVTGANHSAPAYALFARMENQKNANISSSQATSVTHAAGGSPTTDINQVLTANKTTTPVWSSAIIPYFALTNQ